MNKARWLLSGLSCLVIALLLGCSQPANPSPTPTGTASPSPKTTLTPSPSASPKPSPTAAPVSFAGKIITVINPFAAGGGSDIVARVYTRHMAKLLPGNPSMIVRNMPGGGQTVGANYAYSSRPDGLTLLTSGGGVLLAYLTGSNAVRYDLKKMEAIVGVPDGNFFYAKPGLVNKAEELPEAKGIVAGSGGGSAAWLAVIVKESLPIATEKLVLAYSGSGEVRRAFLSGEINLAAEGNGGYAANIASWVAKGEAMPLFQSGILNEKGEIVRDPGLSADIPTAAEIYQKLYGKPVSGIGWDAYKAVLAAARGYQNVLWTPPGTPDGIMRAYWDAAQKMVKDSSFLKESGLAASPWKVGEAYSKEVKANVTIDPKTLDWVKSTLTRYGIVLEGE